MGDPVTARHMPITMRTSSHHDELQRAHLSGYAAIRLLSQRCAEAQAQGAPNQDYAVAVAAPDGNTLSFCVADGVGSSFHGEIAAVFLARRLVQWLDALPALPMTDIGAAERLRGELITWRTEAQALLHEIALPAETPALVREVMEELREGYGTETVFLAGRFDAARREGAARAAHIQRGWFCWMGNIAARIQLASGEWLAINGDDDAARWSSVRGLCGSLSTRHVAQSEMRRLLIWSDGAQALAAAVPALSDAELSQRARALLELPTSDDVTVLDVCWCDNGTDL